MKLKIKKHLNTFFCFSVLANKASVLNLYKFFKNYNVLLSDMSKGITWKNLKKIVVKKKKIHNSW